MTTAILFGYYGFGNTGDEQLLDTSIRIIKELPISINYVVANGPRSTPFPSFNRWNIFHWAMHLNQSSYLIFGGGSVFQSGTSCRSLMFYLFIVLLARLFGCKVILLCHGWGPFRSQWHQSIARIILKDAYRSWRLRMDDPQFDQDATFCDLTLTEPIDNCKKPQLNCIGVALRHAFDEKRLQEKLAISEPIISIDNDDHPKNKGVYLADIWDANSTSVSILITDRFHSAVWAIRHSIFWVGVSGDPKLIALAASFGQPCYSSMEQFLNSTHKFEFTQDRTYDIDACIAQRSLIKDWLYAALSA